MPMPRFTIHTLIWVTLGGAVAATAICAAAILTDSTGADPGRLIDLSLAPLAVVYIALASAVAPRIWRRWLSKIHVPRRISLRVVMILVGAVGAPLGLALERHSRFLDEANRHRPQLVTCCPVYEACSKEGWRPTGVYLDRYGDSIPAGQATRLLTRNAWHEEMADKYRHAARYPWLPVEPDPPSPK